MTMMALEGAGGATLAGAWSTEHRARRHCGTARAAKDKFLKNHVVWVLQLCPSSSHPQIDLAISI